MKLRVEASMKKIKFAVLKLILKIQQNWRRADEIQQKIDAQKTESILKHGTDVNRFR